ncbi:MAG: type II secretion system F family protein [Aliidongia sp.]
MPNYRYEARNVEGHNVTGLVLADDQRLALRDLRRRGLTPFVLVVEAAKGRSRFAPGRKPKTLDYIQFLKQTALLLEAGVNLDQTLQSMVDAPAYRSLQSSIDGVRREIRQGSRLSAALRKSLAGLPPYAYQLVEAGEMTGQLRQSIGDAAQQMDWDYRIAKEIRTALTYPSVLMAGGLTVVLFLFTFVVPRFATMFKNHENNIPTLSKIVMAMGTFFNQHMPIVFGGLAVGGFALYRIFQIPAARRGFYEVMLRLPVVGGWLKESETGRWAGMFATLLANKVQLIQGMVLARSVVQSRRFQASLSQVERAVRGGSTMAKALEDYTDLQPTVINLVSVGERSGSLAPMLRSAAILCDENGRERMKRFLTLVEPIAIVVIGLIVGTLAASIFLAMASLGDAAL